jgi:succinyl-CoA synthetase beta subunit
MDIYEYQAAEFLKRQGIPVNLGLVCVSVNECAAAAASIDGPVVLKAQVHSGGRGKAGGVKLARTPEEAREAARRILGMDIRGRTVRMVLVAPAVDIVHEYYLGVTIDRTAHSVTMIASAEGGVDIEQVARETPEKIAREAADPFLGLHAYQARRLGFALGFEPGLVNGFADIAGRLYRTFVESDTSLAEINPLVLTADRRWMALDSKIALDDNALFRHPVYEDLRDHREEDPTELEARAAGLSFVKLDGDIGCIVNGAGLSMATMDVIKSYGGETANFLDIGGGANSQQVAAALRLVLSEPKVRGVLINIFGGITRCDVVAHGLLDAFGEVEVTVPLVIRLVGTNQAEGRAILADAGITTVDSMPEAARRVVAAAGGAA